MPPSLDLGFDGVPPNLGQTTSMELGRGAHNLQPARQVVQARMPPNGACTCSHAARQGPYVLKDH